MIPPLKSIKEIQYLHYYLVDVQGAAYMQTTVITDKHQQLNFELYLTILI